MVTQLEHDDAVSRRELRLQTQPLAIAARFNPNTRTIVIDLNRGYSLAFPPERVQGLENATQEQLAEIEITCSGLGIYLPRLDADYSVQGFVEGRFGNDRWEAAWAAAHLPTQAA